MATKIPTSIVSNYPYYYLTDRDEWRNVGAEEDCPVGTFKYAFVENEETAYWCDDSCNGTDRLGGALVGEDGWKCY